MNSIAHNESQWEYLHQGSWQAVSQGFLLFQQADLFEQVPLDAKASLSRRNPAYLVCIRIYTSLHELCKGQAEIDTGPDPELHVPLPSWDFTTSAQSLVEWRMHTLMFLLLSVQLSHSALEGRLSGCLSCLRRVWNLMVPRTTWTYVLQCTVNGPVSPREA